MGEVCQYRPRGPNTLCSPGHPPVSEPSASLWPKQMDTGYSLSPFRSQTKCTKCTKMSCSVPTQTDQKADYNVSPCHPTLWKSNPNNNQIHVNARVACASHKVTDVNHSGAAPSSNHGVNGTSFVERNYFLMAIGQETPVPPRPQ